MRLTRALGLFLVLILLAACGGGGASTDGDGGNGDDTEATDPPAEETDDSGDGGDGDGGGGGGTGDLEDMVERLTPPNATEVSRTTAGGVIFVIWETPDDPGSLTGFYEDAIADLGFEVVSTTSSEQVTSWIFGNDGDAGGVVGVAPSTSGGTGSTVSAQVGTGE